MSKEGRRVRNARRKGIREGWEKVNRVSRLGRGKGFRDWRYRTQEDEWFGKKNGSSIYVLGNWVEV